MANLYDVKLKESIFSSNFRNSGFNEHVEFHDDYHSSDEHVLHLAERAYFSWKKYVEVNPDRPSPSQEFIFRIESLLMEVLARIELQGFKVDKKRLTEIGKEIDGRIRVLETEIHDVVGERFNINSTKQLQAILFEKLKIPTSKKIKTGFSVDNEALESISKEYAVASLILEHRGLRKLQTTYVEGLLKTLDPRTDKVHTTFNQVGTSTGRLSSENPNLQNIPAGDGYAQEIKSCFIPSRSGYRILVADYSQVELRVLANLSKDPVLVGSFKDGEDIHTRTAKYLFGDKAISSEERRRAKTVNFGVIYGISGFGLSKQIGIPVPEANAYIEKFYQLYAGVRGYYDALLEQARIDGYVETFFGRRRYIKNLNDANRIIRGQAEREAINMPIQGTAADVIKLAMLEIDHMLTDGGYKTKMILQVHDELVFEIHEDELHLEAEIKRIMENQADFEAKLLVETGIGKNWKQAKK